MTRLAAFLLILVACASKPPAKSFIETRVPTAGAPLLALLPPGADAVAELDVDRLRRNATAAPLVDSLVARRAASEAKIDVGFDALGDLDIAAAAVYRLATDESAILFVVRGERLRAAEAVQRVPHSQAIDATTLAVGPADLRASVAEIADGRGRGALRDDPDLSRLRERAMPKTATGAVLRIAARLDKDARIRAAGRLGVDEVPATLSLWLDVADDAAMVAWAAADNDGQARRIGDSAVRLFHRLGRGEARAEPHGTVTRVVWTVGPRALERWVAELRRTLTSR